MTTQATYRLGSAPMVSAPGTVRWAINGYKFAEDRPLMVRVIADTWGVPDDAATALLAGTVPYTVEGETVVFTIEG